MVGRFHPFRIILMTLLIYPIVYPACSWGQQKNREAPPASVTVAKVTRGRIAPQSEFIATVFYYRKGFANQTTSKTQEATIQLSFKEAFNGTTKRLNLGNEVVEVRIPPGAKPESKIRVRGKGTYNIYTKQRGDLYLKVNLKPHNFFNFRY